MNSLDSSSERRLAPPSPSPVRSSRPAAALALTLVGCALVFPGLARRAVPAAARDADPDRPQTTTTPTASSTPSATVTASATIDPLITPTETETPTASATASLTPAPTVTGTPTATPTPGPTFTAPATPFSLTVTSLSDSGPGSLRAVVAAAQAGDTIGFGLPGTIRLASAVLLDKDLSLLGPGAEQLSIEGGDQTRCLRVAAGATVLIRGLRLAHCGAGEDPVPPTSTPKPSASATPTGTSTSTPTATLPPVPLGPVGRLQATATGSATSTAIPTATATPTWTATPPVSDEAGGAIFNRGRLTLEDCVLEDNFAGGFFAGGGAVYSERADLVIRRGQLRRNESATGGGGALYLFHGTALIEDSALEANASLNRGGAIYSRETELLVDRSLLVGNGAPAGAAINSSTLGAGRTVLSNVTLTGNTGSAAIQSQGVLHVLHSTLSNPVGDLWVFGSGRDETRLAGSLFHVPGGQAPACAALGGAVIIDGFGNLQHPDASCGAGIPVADPLLGALADHGGATRTLALGAGSPAIDAAGMGACMAEPVAGLDQRGHARPVDGDAMGGAACDAGAFEAGSVFTPTPGFTPPTPAPTFTPSPSPTATATLTASATPTPTTTLTPTITPTLDVANAPDLIFVSLVGSATSQGCGRPPIFVYQAVIKNQGPGPAGRFVAAVGENLHVIAGLAAGAERTLSGPGFGITGEVDAEHEVQELDETNNTIQGVQVTLTPEPTCTPTPNVTLTSPPATVSATVTHPPTVTPTRTGTAQVTVEPSATAGTPASATPTPPGSLTLRGLVYNAAIGPSAPLAGAIVAVGVCQPRQPFVALTGTDGRYQILVPEPYPLQCANLQLSVEQGGFASYHQTFTTASLRAQPNRDVALTPLGTGTDPDWIYLPVILKRGTLK